MVKIKNRVMPIYKEVTREFIDYLYKEVMEDGWSLLYASRNLKGGIHKIKKNFTKYPELEYIYLWYMFKNKYPAKDCKKIFKQVT